MVYISCARLYRIVVMEVGTKAKRSLNVINAVDLDPSTCGACCTGACYIAAQLHHDQLPMTFTLGNKQR